MNWYQRTYKSILDELEVNAKNGLSASQAKERLKIYGTNNLASKKKETLPGIFAKQFKSPLIYILIFAAILVSFLGQQTDTIVIVAVLITNAIIGTIQEGRAQNSLEKLKSLTRHQASVRRDGEELLVSVEELVPGDILLIHEGDLVLADARIINSESLTVNESILTGEAYMVAKTPDVINKENLVVGDQKNMLFSGTSVSSGYAESVVVATGLSSELGKISEELLETSSVQLPLEKKVINLSHLIAASVLIIASLVFAIGVLRGIAIKEIFTAVVGLSVSIVPEGLPIAVTIVLAKGVWRMARAKAIVRKMAAVEAMGSAQTLLVDKTGTITTGKMQIKHVYTDGALLEIEGSGYNPQGKIKGKSSQIEKLKRILSLVYLSLNADVIKQGSVWKPVGDSTEASIAVLCKKAGLSKTQLSHKFKTIEAKPFNSKKRYIEATFSSEREIWEVYIGAPDFLSQDLKIDHTLTKDYHNLANQGLRVIGVAIYGPEAKRFFGYALLVIDEEIRPNVSQSIEEAKSAGFKIAMITGDFPATGKSIAAKVGIFKKGDAVITGEDVGKMSIKELSTKVGKATVFARISPEHKLKIVNAFKSRGDIVAMTGDGVNDAPALQAANLGICFGSGTQVAKDAADIILVDNNFSTITAAIAEGRAIYQTLKKVILYLFSTSLGEILSIALAIIIGLPLPLVAVQIIWLNFVTDGFLVVALAQEPPENNLSEKYSSQNLVDKTMVKRILLMGFSMFIATLPIFYFILNNHSLSHARSMALVILSVTQWFNALNVRSKEKSIFKIPLTNNLYLVGAFLIVAALQVLAVQTSFGNKLFHTVPLTLNYWFLGIFASSLIIVSEEVRKLFLRSKIEITANKYFQKIY